ncbi:MAG: glutaminase A [Verrucomicrobiota bacterium]
MGSDFFSELRSSSPVQDYLQHLHDLFQQESAGAVADYIPELFKANPEWFGISMVTMDGHVYEVGDTQVPFTIQSISKPFVYGLGLEDHGRTDVLKKIGVEPSGEAFNSISLRPETGQPFNPMINAGAIAATGLIEGNSHEKKFERILKMFETYCGRELNVDETIYQSESNTGHRNRAIGYMLRNFDILDEDPTPILENYFKQCSISVTGKDLAVIGATLANAGVNPVTGQQAVRSEYVENILSLMGTCGMYDYAGEWIYKVGMPAKSGVAGGIVAVLPGQLGIGIFSPPLDDRGNSVRGIQACHKISMDFNLHMFNVPNSTGSIIRSVYHGNEVSSDRVRPLEERGFLKDASKRILIYELQGELNFATAEIVLRKINDSFEDFDFLVINLKRVLHMDESACKLFYSLFLRTCGMNKKIIFTHTAAHRILRRCFAHHLNEKNKPIPPQLFIEDAASALEYCENNLLLGHSGSYGGARSSDIHQHEFFENLKAEEIKMIQPLLKPMTFEADALILEAGTEANEIYLLNKGTVSVSVSLPNGRQQRLATFSPGVSFGELALGGSRPRSANIYADETVECYSVTLEDFHEFCLNHTEIGIKLMQNVLRLTASRLDSANKAISALA